MKIKLLIFLIVYFLSILNGFCQIPSIDKNWNKISAKSDDFNSFDLTSWKVQNNMLHEKPDESNCWVFYTDDSENIDIVNGKLKISVVEKDTTFTGNYASYGQSWNGTDHNYTSGWYNRRDSLGYGYFEAKLKSPKGYGMWPAFWLWMTSNEVCYYNEVDIWEPIPQTMSDAKCFGTNIYFTNEEAYRCNGCTGTIKDANKINKPFHIDGSTSYSDYGSHPWTFYPIPDLSAAEHVYGCEWLPDRLIFYFDNKIIREEYDTDLIAIFPMQVVFNVAIGNQYCPNDPGTPTVTFPQTMEVDYFYYYEMDLSKYTQQVTSINYATHDYGLRKSYNLSNTTIPSSTGVTLRATDYIQLNGTFSVPLGSEFAAIPTPYYTQTTEPDCN